MRHPHRPGGMEKFEIKMTHLGYIGWDNSNQRLIYLGTAIGLFKQNSKSESHCYQNDRTFDYHDIQNALIPNSYENTAYFTPKRIIVIQMN